MALSPAIPVVRLRGACLHAVSETATVEVILRSLAAGRGGWIVTMNLDHLRRFDQEPSYAALCANANLVVADGMPLIWASWLQATPLPERVAGSNLIWRISAAAAGRGLSVFLLGGAPGHARAAARVLQRHCPGLRIAGTCCPEMGFERDNRAVARICAAVQSARPDIIYVGLGSPKQEILIQRLRRIWPAAWCIGVGISFSFVGGQMPRAPLWVRRAGFEWLHRLLHEPRRLASRYLFRGLPFLLLLLAGAARRRFDRSRCCGG